MVVVSIKESEIGILGHTHEPRMIDVQIDRHVFRLTVVEARKLRDKLNLVLLEHEPPSLPPTDYLKRANYRVERSPLWWENPVVCEFPEGEEHG